MYSHPSVKGYGSTVKDSTSTPSSDDTEVGKMAKLNRASQRFCAMDGVVDRDPGILDDVSILNVRGRDHSGKFDSSDPNPMSSSTLHDIVSPSCQGDDVYITLTTRSADPSGIPPGSAVSTDVDSLGED